MKNYRILFVVCILALVANWAYTQSQATKENMAVITINAVMSKQPIPVTVSKGTTFTVNLASNPTTGYSWALKSGYNSKIAQKVGSVYNPPSEQIPGRGGSETWTFKGIGKGRTNLTLNYVRPWEKNTPPVKTQTFAITIQ